MFRGLFRDDWKRFDLPAYTEAHRYVSLWGVTYFMRLHACLSLPKWPETEQENDPGITWFVLLLNFRLFTQSSVLINLGTTQRPVRTLPEQSDVAKLIPKLCSNELHSIEASLRILQRILNGPIFPFEPEHYAVVFNGLVTETLGAALHNGDCHTRLVASQLPEPPRRGDLHVHSFSARGPPRTCRNAAEKPRVATAARLSSGNASFLRRAAISCRFSCNHTLDRRCVIYTRLSTRPRSTATGMNIRSESKAGKHASNFGLGGSGFLSRRWDFHVSVEEH